jgi:hypothetical protein
VTVFRFQGDKFNAHPLPWCKPQTLQTSIFTLTLSKRRARAPRIGIWPGRTPFAWAYISPGGHNCPLAAAHLALETFQHPVQHLELTRVERRTRPTLQKIVYANTQSSARCASSTAPRSVAGFLSTHATAIPYSDSPVLAGPGGAYVPLSLISARAWTSCVHNVPAVQIFLGR